MSFQRHLCLALLLGLSSCTYLEKKFGGMMSSSKKSSGDKKIGEAKVIGVIEMVNPEQNYVLINCEQRVDIPAGTEIISQGVNGSNARLKVTPERKGNYITADITQGMPQLRDLVVYQVKAAEDAAAPATGPMAAPSAPLVPLTPIMQGDVPPPLNTPFQPMGTLQSVQGQIPPQNQSTAPVNQIPQSMLQPIPLPPKTPKTSQPSEEPAADLSKLPPVIR